MTHTRRHPYIEAVNRTYLASYSRGILCICASTSSRPRQTALASGNNMPCAIRELVQSRSEAQKSNRESLCTASPRPCLTGPSFIGYPRHGWLHRSCRVPCDAPPHAACGCRRHGARFDPGSGDEGWREKKETWLLSQPRLTRSVAWDRPGNETGSRHNLMLGRARGMHSCLPTSHDRSVDDD